MILPAHAVVLLAEDDDDDYLLIQEVMKEFGPLKGFHRVKNGEELLESLVSIRPHLILLDLNLPKKDGREVLREIKGHPEFKTVPVVVLTTSNAPEDITRCYALGANSFVRKPLGFHQYKEVLKEILHYWLVTDQFSTN